MGLLIDSTVLIDAERARWTPEALVRAVHDRFGDRELALSLMTAGELFHGCLRADTAVRRALREESVETVLAAIPVAPMTLATMRLFGRIDAELRAAGQRLPTSDLLIASTALARGDAVVTGDARRFDRVPGLTIHLQPLTR